MDKGIYSLSPLYFLLGQECCLCKQESNTHDFNYHNKEKYYKLLVISVV